MDPAGGGWSVIESGSRVLVTGATGFIGGRLAERLLLEHDVSVRALVRNPATAVRLARFPVDLFPGDLTDERSVREAMRDCDLVFHCAHDSTSLRGHRASGYHGTRNVATAAIDEGVDRMVHLSSVVVYGDAASGDISESSPWKRGSGRYTAAKRAGEKVVLRMHEEHGLPVSVVQPTIVYGPFGDAWTARPLNALRTGLVPLLDGGTGLCNAVYVDDVVDGILAAAWAPEAVGERFLISGDEPVSWRRFYGAFEELLGYRSTIDVSEDQLASLRRLERRRAREEVRALARRTVREALGRPESLETLLELRSARIAAEVTSRVLPDRHWRALKRRLRHGGRPVRETGDLPRKVHVPDAHETALYASRARVRIDKATTLLGYQPRFDFDRGMTLTAEYLSWARLL